VLVLLCRQGCPWTVVSMMVSVLLCRQGCRAFPSISSTSCRHTSRSLSRDRVTSRSGDTALMNHNNSSQRSVDISLISICLCLAWYSDILVKTVKIVKHLQCFDSVVWVTGRTSGLWKAGVGLLVVMIWLELCKTYTLYIQLYDLYLYIQLSPPLPSPLALIKSRMETMVPAYWGCPRKWSLNECVYVIIVKCREDLCEHLMQYYTLKLQHHVALL